MRVDRPLWSWTEEAFCWDRVGVVENKSKPRRRRSMRLKGTKRSIVIPLSSEQLQLLYTNLPMLP